ncbi:HPr family phosphocarrier protein [Nitrosococcus oceani]|uniref:Phosphoryl transfer system, HPr n=2 Tax=Nitrosococcus oceani TaxID=1229 RepID=Q3J7F0_NITOC|nr:HPr family phosphocarrier protein [Nitrosococcus oceani]KFI18274.1 phosphocarrier protein HPr [Nitrosococcus oceani C-27]ABA59246.1 Phosphoryl transfer system, HPr [Nitrosococcus oceani ATCC 19707]EDZ65810.1 phosphocarrier, HPr family [Nitrosococcus oceani AFC27]KFI21452.1 phosphocarrier protein HPr [Nitrosococcus oceani]GEM21071.1 phosphocarrier protein HPr [Nitrosococcus oceani]
MTQSEVTIINKLGLHARAAAKFVTLASRFKSEICVRKGTKEVNGKSIMGVMMLAASQGTRLSIVVSGPDEKEALEQLQALVNKRFGEHE